MKLSKLKLWLYKNIVMKYKGLPALVVVYKPWRKGKNVIFSSIFPFDQDEYLVSRFEEISERIRKNYQKELNKIMDLKSGETHE
jgi:hypothetical protein